MLRRSRRHLLAAAAASVLVLGSAACGGTTKNNSSDTGSAGGQAAASADPNAKLKTGLKIAYLPKQLNNPYSEVETGGGKVAVGELKGEYKLVGPN
ncbi:MAG TPA: rhamnose ABC transporter substrate-binding protein, partial [Actinoplanes sp.]